MLKKNLDDYYIEMTFNYNPHISNSTWIGTIAKDSSQMGDNAMTFHQNLISFTLDATSVEVIDFSVNNIESSIDWDEIVDEMNSTTVGAQIDMTNKLLELLPRPDQEEIENLEKLARYYAIKHFESSVVEVELGIYMNGSAFFEYSPSETIPFVAHDQIDRFVEIRIHREALQIQGISTPLDSVIDRFTTN
jgi:hypothetical protein